MPEKRKCCRCDLEKDVASFDPVPYTSILKTTCRSCIKEMIELLKRVPGRAKKPEIDRVLIREKELKRQRDYEKRHFKPPVVKPVKKPDATMPDIESWG